MSDLNLPTVTVDSLAQVFRTAPEHLGAGGLAEYVLSQLGVDDAGTYALVPVEQMEKAWLKREFIVSSHGALHAPHCNQVVRLINGGTRVSLTAAALIEHDSWIPRCCKRYGETASYIQVIRVWKEQRDE